MQLVFPAGKDAFLRSYTTGGKRATRLASGLRCDGRRSKAFRGRADIVCTVLGYIVDGAFDARCRGGISLFTFLCYTHSRHLVLRASRHRCYPLQ